MRSGLCRLSMLVALSGCATTRVIDTDSGVPGGAIHVTQNKLGDKTTYYLATRVDSGVDLAEIMTAPDHCTVMRHRERPQSAIGTVTAATTAATLAVLKPDAQRKYQTINSDEQPMSWSPGDTLTVTVQDEAAPPLAISVVAPAPLEHLTVPGQQNATTLSISTLRPFEVTWAPGTGDLVEVSFLSSDERGPLDTLICMARDTGKLTVPRRALSLLRGSRGAFTVTRLHAKMIRIGQIPIAVLAQNAVSFSTVSFDR